jgi:glycosyltransferase involved in cell wall biosynthesis
MSDRVKVLYLIERLARAGTELHVLKVLQRLDRSRFEPVLCCLSEETTDKSLLPKDVPHRLLGAGWNLVHPRTYLVYRRLRELIAREKPDVLHSFLFVANVLGSFAARREKTPCVVASRGRMGIEWKAHVLHRMTQRAANRRCDLLICKTQAMAREAERLEGMPRERIRVIPNGVEIDRFAFQPGAAAENRRLLQEEHGISADGPLVIAVGNLKPVKGHRTLVEAAAALVDSFPRLQVAIVGKGESAAELRAAIRSHELARRVFLPGNFEDVRPWMRAADVFVAPSLSEGMPNAVLEAMAMGLPVVLSDIPGHVEAAGPDAWYFQPQDAEGLAQALADALASPNQRAERGRAGYERVRAQMSVDAMVRRIESLYCELVGGRRP